MMRLTNLVSCSELSPSRSWSGAWDIAFDSGPSEAIAARRIQTTLKKHFTSHLQIQSTPTENVPNNAHHCTLTSNFLDALIVMAAQVDTAGPVYAVIGGGIAGVSCAEEVSLGSWCTTLGSRLYTVPKCHRCIVRV